MTKKLRQPQPKPAPKRKAVTLAECGELAKRCGFTGVSALKHGSLHPVYFVSTHEVAEIAIEMDSRSAALRIMHAALQAMAKERR